MRFCPEPLAREIGQPLPTFTTQNKFTLPYLYRKRGKIQPVASAGKSNQWQARENNVTEVMTVSFFSLSCRHRRTPESVGAFIQGLECHRT